MGSEVPDIWISRFATQHQKNAVFGYLRGRYSTSELRELDDYAWSYGIELIPCIQTLAHLEDAFRWPCFDEIKDCDNILLCGDEKTYTFIEAMIRACRNSFRTKRIHIGMEKFHKTVYKQWITECLITE